MTVVKIGPAALAPRLDANLIWLSTAEDPGVLWLTLDAIAVGVAVKFAKVPPTAATAIAETAAKLRRIFDSGRFLSIERVIPFGG